MKTQKNVESFFGEVIYSYTRAKAIEDGVLADLSEMAREVGIKFPVAITEAAFDKCIAVPSGCEGFQDVRGRQWDVLSLLRWAIKKSLSSSSLIFFQVNVVVAAPEKRQDVKLKAVCGPGDSGEPVITIMFPEED